MMILFQKILFQNVEFLEKNHDFTFSSSPCRFDNELDVKNYKIFDFDRNQFERVKILR